MAEDRDELGIYETLTPEQRAFYRELSRLKRENARRLDLLEGRCVCLLSWLLSRGLPWSLSRPY